MKRQNSVSNNVITPEMIFLDKSFEGQDEVISFIADKAKSLHYISNEKEFYESVKSREKEVSTAIGYSIAIPHGKTNAVQHPFIAFLRIPHEIQWSNQNEEKVQLIFLIGVPKESESKLHLKFISQLSKKLLDDEFREKLIVQKNANKVFEQLSLIEI